MTELEKLKLWLSQAENALHDLSIGGAVVSLSENDRKITYTAANIGRLRDYIDDLKRRICALENPVRPRQGPVRFTF